MHNKDLQKEVLELREQLRFYREIIDQAPGHLYWKGSDNRYLGCNLEQAKSSGFSSEAIKGKTILDIVAQLSGEAEQVCEAERLHLLDRSVLSSGKALAVEETAKQPNGEVFTYLSHKVPYYNEQKEVIGLIGSTLNVSSYVSKQLKLTNLLQKMTEANDKILRAPVGNVIGAAQILLLNPEISDEIRSKVKDIYYSANQIVPVLDRVGVYLNLMNSDEEGFQEAVNLNAVILHMLEKSLRGVSDGVEIRYSQSAAMTHEIFLDHQVFGEIIATLVRYLADYTPSKVLRCALRCDTEADNNYCFTFVFTAKTNVLANLDKASVFNFLDNVTDNFLIDHSLELSIIKCLAGRIEGGGFDYFVKDEHTCFTVKFSSKKAEAAVASERYHAVLTHQESIAFDPETLVNFRFKHASEVMNILLVEDDMISQRVVSSMLSELANVSIRIASSNAEVASMLDRNEAFDLIVLDLNLTDGLSVSQLPIFFEKYPKAPIVVTSANNIEKSIFRDRFLAQKQVAAVYRKPLNFQNICQILSIGFSGL